jgi:tetratricopeptide (TPR) repeat protein/predicted phosphodiesterase
MAGLTWLHLSDWHQKDESFDRGVVRDALIKDIKERKDIHQNLEEIDFIIFSGDLAFNGKKEEFKLAEEYFIEPVLKATGLDKKDFFMVPGNHDLDRTEFKLLPERLRKPLTTKEEIIEWLDSEKERQRVLAPFANYEAFIKAYGIGTLTAYSWLHEFEKGGKTIALMGFNSALMCGRSEDDYGKLIIGEPQVYETLQKAEKATLSIAVTHHPFIFLTGEDQTIVEDRLQKGCHILVSGHQHRVSVSCETGTSGACTIIRAGAAFNRRVEGDPRYTCSYNFVHLDMETGKGNVYLRQWQEDDFKWGPHQREPHPNGEYEISLPGKQEEKKNKEENEPSDTGKPPEPVTAKYDLAWPVFHLEYRAKGDGMVGREEALKKVRAQLVAGKRTSIGHTAAFQGMGGLGKTQLAVEYAHKFRDEYPKGVIWLNADQDTSSQLIAIAIAAKWIAPESGHAYILETAIKRLKTFSDCLIIFDNVEQVEDIEPYLPNASATPHLLLTSRTPQKGFTPVSIDLLDGSQALQLLLKESNRRLDRLSAEEQTAAQEIAGSLDGLPLAIEIAGAYLNHVTDCTFENYKAMMAANLSRVMKGELVDSFTDHEENLFITLQISRQVIDKATLLPEILDLLAWSGTSFMGTSLMATILDKEDFDLVHPLSMGITLRLLHKAEEGEGYQVHRLLRQVRREQFPIKDRSQWVEQVAQRLGDWFEKRRQAFTDLPVFEAEIDHLHNWLAHVKPLSDELTARLTWLLAYPPFHWGKYKESHQQVKSAFSILEKLPDADLELKANILNSIGATLSRLGNHKEALTYNQQALEIRQQLFGEKHPDTAPSLNNVGNTFCELGDHKEALSNHKKALQIRQEFFGEKHPDTARSLNNVGSTYGELGDRKEALSYHKKALQIRQQLFGEKHPDTAQSLNNVGGTYGKLGDHKKALEFKERAFKINSEILGHHHPDTANFLGGIIYSLIKLKRFSEASDRVTAYLEDLPRDHPKYELFSRIKIPKPKPK